MQINMQVFNVTVEFGDTSCFSLKQKFSTGQQFK